jgi:hypothetical protein
MSLPQITPTTHITMGALLKLLEQQGVKVSDPTDVRGKHPTDLIPLQPRTSPLSD